MWTPTAAHVRCEQIAQVAGPWDEAQWAALYDALTEAGLPYTVALSRGEATARGGRGRRDGVRRCLRLGVWQTLRILEIRLEHYFGALEHAEEQARAELAAVLRRE